MPIDADGWVKILGALFDGMPKLALAVKDIILAFGIVWGAYATSNASGKIDAQSVKLDVAASKADVAASKADVAAAKSESVEKTVEETNRGMDAQLDHIAMTAKAILTQNADDMNKAKDAEKKAEAVKASK